MPTTQLLPLAVQSFTTTAGLPLIGGLLYAYAAGTSTPQATYIDQTGVTPNVNPVVLNVRGEASVWLTKGQAYKFVLQDAAANVLWTADNISSWATSAELTAAIATFTSYGSTVGSGVINGNFNVNQRLMSGTVILVSGAYGHDRWRAGAAGATYTFATTNNVTTLTILAGSLQQVIEGPNLENGLYCLSWAGSSTGKIGAGAFSASGVTNTITGGVDTAIEFGVGTLSKVQIELGLLPTYFRTRPVGFELVLCQRYFYRIGGNSVNEDVALGVFTSATTVNSVIRFPVQMRAIPVITPIGLASNWQVLSAATFGASSIAAATISIDSLNFGFTVAGATAGQAAYIRSLATSTYITVSAEF